MSRIFYHGGTFRRHYKSVHLNSHEFSCDKCHKTYNRKDNFLLHYKKCKGCAYLCHNCRKQFKSKKAFRSHKIKCLLKRKDFQCANCLRIFLHNDHLIKHISECRCKSWYVGKGLSKSESFDDSNIIKLKQHLMKQQ